MLKHACGANTLTLVTAFLLVSIQQSTNFIGRMWPRASAVGERGWSAMNVTDVDDAQNRLFEWNCKMIQRDIGAEPMVSGAAYNGAFSFCEWEYVPVYRPPWQ